MADILSGLAKNEFLQGFSVLWSIGLNIWFLGYLCRWWGRD